MLKISIFIYLFISFIDQFLLCEAKWGIFFGIFWNMLNFFRKWNRECKLFIRNQISLPAHSDHPSLSLSLKRYSCPKPSLSLYYWRILLPLTGPKMRTWMGSAWVWTLHVYYGWKLWSNHCGWWPHFGEALW